MNLASINEDLIRLISEKLQLKTNFYRASDLKLEGVRSDKLIRFCDFFQATKYLSPLGSKEYLETDNFSGKANAKLEFQNYLPSIYPQKGIDNFISHLSIVDVICNLGFLGASSYILNNK